VDGQKFGDVSALIQAALRHGQYQPWMHQALGLALQAQGAPPEEVERALMSAVDLSKSADDVMYTAMYMTRIGLDRRALALFRDVAEAYPLRPEPYVQALQVAQRLGDVDAVRWACVNVMRHAWPKEHRDVFDKAVRVAKATALDLYRQQRRQDAERFEDALNEALSRDCVVRVTWTGDADIDLAVEEPSGTICSLRNQRTTAGGVMLGDSISNPGQKSADGVSETYVCPEAFPGEYRVSIRRVWGKVAAGKVTVDLVTNVRTDRERTSCGQHIRRQIPLGEKDAMVVFTLPVGRRQQPLEEQQVASAAVKQLAINRSILAQQLEAVADRDVGRDFSAAEIRRAAAIDPRNALALDRILRGQGAVGFQPQITTLPEGTIMFAQAVISADRRYVRVAPSPQFSTIGDVFTFNFATGQGGQQQGGAGGGGLGGGGLGGLGGGGLGGGGFGGGGFGGGGFGGGGFGGGF
jgi:hypothetical protein